MASITKKEVYDSFEKTETRYGATILRTIICDWTARSTYKPMIGDLYPGERALRCTEVRWRGVGQPALSGAGYIYEQIRFDCTYSTAPFVENMPIETWDFSGEVLETAEGRTWLGTGKPCESSQGIFYPTITRNISMVVSQVNTGAVFTSLGGVNWTLFQGFPAGTLLLEGANIANRYDYERDIYTYQLDYRFIYRRIPHNYIWRAPKQALDPDTDAPMIDDDGYPVYITGPEGIGGWDMPYPALYPVVDFGPLFGYPPNPPPWMPEKLPGLDNAATEATPDIPWMATKK